MYIHVLRRICDASGRKRSEEWRTKSWFLLRDNAPAHRPVFVKDFLEMNKETTQEHSPYYTCLATADLYLFPRLKSTSKGGGCALWCY